MRVEEWETPTCRMWFVQKVVAMGIPRACRKVLYCIEQIKLIRICVICTGACSGRAPKKNTTTISNRIRAVSHRIRRSRLPSAASETKAPRQYADMGIRKYSARSHSPFPNAIAKSTKFPVWALQNTPPRIEYVNAPR